MSTPLYDALNSYAAKKTLRFHMPGHKGKFLPGPGLEALAAVDVTELPGTGNLYEAGEPFDSAQGLWAELFGFDHCQFLTGGSTMGIHTGLALCAQPGSKVLIDRACHRAVFHALALLDLEPVYLERTWRKEDNLIGPILPEDVKKKLDQNPDIKTVCITSPTYAGMLSDIREISHMVHAYGGKLFVDGAHGAHLFFLGNRLDWDVDALVVSAHKTLPAMGQSALLFTNWMEVDRVRQMASVYGSSSPSYPMMASLDTARQWLVEGGRFGYVRASKRVAQLRERFPSVRDGDSLDPCRFVLKVKDGPAFGGQLREQGIFPEMEDSGHVVFICTAQDNEEDFDRLEAVLETLEDGMGDCIPIPPPPLPKRVLSPRNALFAASRRRSLDQCEGEISACQIAPYPPGVPVVVPGEQIGKKELAYLREIGYNMQSEVRVIGGEPNGMGK